VAVTVTSVAILMIPAATWVMAAIAIVIKIPELATVALATMTIVRIKIITLAKVAIATTIVLVIETDLATVEPLVIPAIGILMGFSTQS
jgi:hypothetical protein